MRRWASELANCTHEDVEYGNAWERIAIVPTVGWPLQSLEKSETKFFHLSVFRFKGLRMSWIMDLWWIYALPGAQLDLSVAHIPSWRWASHLDAFACQRRGRSLRSARFVGEPASRGRGLPRLHQLRLFFWGTLYLTCHLTITKYGKIRSNYQTYSNILSCSSASNSSTRSWIFCHMESSVPWL